KLGMVCMTSSTGSITARTQRKLAMAIPTGMPISTENTTATIISDNVCMAASQRPMAPTRHSSAPMARLKRQARLLSQARPMMTATTAHHGECRSRSSDQIRRSSRGWVSARSRSEYCMTSPLTNSSMGRCRSRAAISSGNMQASLQGGLDALRHVGGQPAGPDILLVLQEPHRRRLGLGLVFFHVGHGLVHDVQRHLDLGEEFGQLRRILG